MSEFRCPEQDVVISSRVRLARNYADVPFAPKMTRPLAEETIARAGNAMMQAREPYRLLRMNELSKDERGELVEHHLISYDLLKYLDFSAAMIAPSEEVSIMVNEEDHLRIQGLLPGMQLTQAAELAFEADERLGAASAYAYDAQWGYLTSCPTNTGTGMRASCMLHLPALAAAGQVSAVLQTISKLGLTVRGLYGEGSEAKGNLYQLSNQVTLGRSEEDMIKTLIAATGEIADHERAVRQNMQSDDSLTLLDKLMRSVGIMGHARKMAAPEFMQRYSDLRLVIAMGIVDGSLGDLDKLMMDLQPASLNATSGTELSEPDQSALRADLLRDYMKTLAQ